jgi:hypothetical protein
VVRRRIMAKPRAREQGARVCGVSPEHKRDGRLLGSMQSVVEGQRR